MATSATESTNFDLRIEGTAGRYRAIAQLQDSAVARHEFDLSDQDACRQPPPLLSGAGRGGRHREVLAALQQARAWGDLLFRKVFAGAILSRFQEERRRARRTGRVLRLRLGLTGAPDLAHLPWELLFDVSRRQFLLHDPGLSLVRCLDVPEPPGPLSVEPPLRVLVAVASPVDRPPLAGEEELRHIEDALGRLRRSGQVFLDWLGPATHEALDERLHECRWHVLHYIGHGAHGPGAPEGALVLEDRARRSDLLDASEVTDLLAAYPDLRLVVLNACRGGQIGEADAFSGVAQALLLGGVPAVVAMQSDIVDAAALAFARHFYRELARTGSVDRALAWARRALSRRKLDLGWASPVLFTLSPDGRIFTPKGIDRRHVHKLATAGALAITAPLAAALSFAIPASPPPPPWKRPVLVHVDDEHCPPPQGLDLNFALIQPSPGPFRMGSNKGIKESRPAHDVTLTAPFCLAVLETTQAQWGAVMGPGSDPSRVHREDFPVMGATWEEVQDFSRRLNEGDPSAPFYLPTEAQWEYAAREGVSAYTTMVKGRPRAGNCAGTAPGDPWDGVVPVGQLDPNQFGLFDMVGNVREWVADGYDSFSRDSVTDPLVQDTGNGRVRRGGAFNSAEKKCTALTRGSADSRIRFQDTGFRIARQPVNLTAPRDSL